MYHTLLLIHVCHREIKHIRNVLIIVISITVYRDYGHRDAEGRQLSLMTVDRRTYILFVLLLKPTLQTALVYCCCNTLRAAPGNCDIEKRFIIIIIKNYIPRLPEASNSLLVRAPDSWSKGCKFESQQEQGRIFFSRVNFVCWLLFDVRFTPVLLQWHVKDISHSAKSAGGTLHLNKHTPLTKQSQSGLTMLLSKHRVGTYQKTSSHATHRGTLGYSHVSSLSHCRLILG